MLRGFDSCRGLGAGSRPVRLAHWCRESQPQLSSWRRLGCSDEFASAGTRMDAHAHRCDLAGVSCGHSPGTRRPVLRVEDYLAYLEEHTYRNDQPRVRPPFGAACRRLTRGAS
jgi:hypothetical protein